ARVELPGPDPNQRAAAAQCGPCIGPERARGEIDVDARGSALAPGKRTGERLGRLGRESQTHRGCRTPADLDALDAHRPRPGACPPEPARHHEEGKPHSTLSFTARPV